mmetsp:Transcript_105780/g.281765  ORF Transcript_105780/g.281765 Transcript_105780/m.281765 type:complete len:205 (-) Transcript_105780:150-764(-)
MIRVCSVITRGVVAVIVRPLHSVHLPDAPLLHEAGDHYVLPGAEAPVAVLARRPEVVRGLLGEEVKVRTLDGPGLDGEEDRAVYVLQPRREVVRLRRPEEDVVAPVVPCEVRERVSDEILVERVHLRGTLVLLGHDTRCVHGHKKEVCLIWVFGAAVAMEKEFVNEHFGRKHPLTATEWPLREVCLIDKNLDTQAGARLGSQAQ